MLKYEKSQVTYPQTEHGARIVVKDTYTLVIEREPEQDRQEALEGFMRSYV